MPAADTAKLVASLTLDAKGFNAGIKNASKQLGGLESSVGNIGRKAQQGVANFGRNAALIGVGVAGALATQVFAGVKSLEDLETAMNATEGVIKSTGGAAGVTAQQVRDLATSFEDITTVDDKTIQQGENLLLTFTNIGSKVFPQATKATIDLAVAMNDGSAEGADLSASAIQIGKALNDPIKGVTALTKVGVSFTKQQKDQIKALQDSGDVVGAQTIILNELEKEFGEAGKAAGQGTRADFARFGDAVEGAQQALATGFLPILSKVAGVLNKKLGDPKVLAAISKLGTTLAGSLDSLISAATRLPWGAIGDSLSIAGAGAKAVLDAFVALPPWVQTAVLTGWGLNKLTGGALSGIVGELGKGLIKGVLGMNAGVVNINAATVNGVPGGGIPGAAPAAAAGGLTAGAVATTGAVAVILAGGAIVSLNAIADEAGKNNQLAAKGLTQQEIVAQKYYSANKADQQTIFKQLHGAIPPISVFETGNAKLQTVAENTATIAARGEGEGPKLQNVANERLEAIRGFTQTSAEATKNAQAAVVAATQQAAADNVHVTDRAEQNVADKIKELNAQARTAAQLAAGDSRSEQAAVRAAATQTANATVTAGNKSAAAGNVVATAVKNKDLSVTVNNKLTISTKISVSNDLNAKNNYKSVYNVAF